MKRFFVTLAIVLLAAPGLFLSYTSVAAAVGAKLWTAPTDVSRFVGETFAVNIYVSSLQTPINAVSGTLEFTANSLEVVNVSKNGSIFSIWVKEPVYDNALGTISFSGGLTPPGFVGSQGQIFSVSFKAKSAGPASVIWKDGQVLANDGQASNILREMQSANISLVEQAVDTGEKPIVKEPVSPAPNTGGAVVSSQMRMQDKIAIILVVAVFGCVLILVGLISRSKDRSKQLAARVTAKTVVAERFDILKKDIVEELWHLEKKIKKGEPFSREERERREKLLRELGEDSEEILSKLQEL